MSRQLVFVHGRSQQGKEADALKAEWIAAWQTGLARAGLALPIDPSDIRFPYYGDTLAQLSAGFGPDQAAPVTIRGALPAGPPDFIVDLIDEVRVAAGIAVAEVDAEIGSTGRRRGPQNWAFVQAVLRLIDRRVPFASAASIALFTRDVHDYLTRAGVATAIDNGVLQAIQPQRATVVVAHSLGTVVAYNVLRREGRARGWQVPLLVTLGSPLGIRRIRDALSPISFPASVDAWFNAYDERDVVALHPLQPPQFAVEPAISNHTAVQNHTENRHGISGYLDDPVVAKRIHDAVLQEAPHGDR